MTEPTPAQLTSWLNDAWDRCLALVTDLSADQRLGPKLELVNPPQWEIGHVAWFHETWFLCHACGEEPSRVDADALYDSMAVDHDLRWDLPLPSWDDTLAYVEQVRERALARLSQPALSPEQRYHARYGVLHADMHAEAFAYTRQTLGYPARGWLLDAELPRGPAGEAEVPGGVVQVGADPAAGFCFDNERWAHPQVVGAFRIARRPASEGEFLAFVNDHGYARRELWDAAGWAWRETEGAQHPVYWRQGAASWESRRFDRWEAIRPDQPMCHVNWHEARAFCRWQGRRLPSEAEWVAAREAGLLEGVGAVWEWTETVFGPFDGFVPDPYQDYSQPWFGTPRVARGGSWTATDRIKRPGYRNFAEPDRRDLWFGFRTCAG